MEIRIIFIGFLVNCLKWLLTPLFWLKTFKRKASLPTVNEPLLLLSATCLAEKIRKQVISSEEVVKAYVKRIIDVNPIINAVVEERFDAAIEDAKKVDAYIAESKGKELEFSKPLLGVPVSIKESCSVAGLSHCVGSLTRLNVKAKEDGEAVRRLKASGAIPLLVSNTPELCLSWECNNMVTGATHNPYNTNCTSGGSSGGEGALLGAAASVIGLGSDIAGSCRLPAMFNGVFGHKSTPGLIPLNGHYPHSTDKIFSEYLVLGPLVRFAEDLKIMMKVLTGNISEKIGLDEEVDLSEITVYFMDDAGYSFVITPVQEEIKIAIKNAVKHLEEVCHSNISNFKFKEMNASGEISIALFFALQDIPYILENPDNPKIVYNVYIEVMKSMFGKSLFFRDTLLYYILQRTNLLLPITKYKKYVAVSKILKEKLLNKLGTSGVFLYPTFSTSAFPRGELLTNASSVIYTMIFNVLGFPSTHIPMGVDKKGMPIGLQVIAAPNQDRLCIAVAIELEKRFGGWRQPNP